MQASINELIRSAARQYGPKTAYADTERTLSFEDVDRLSAVIASAITEQGLFRKPVFVLTGQNVYTPAVFLGVARVGCFYVPVNAAQNTFRIRQILEMVQPELVISVGPRTDLKAGLGYAGPVLFTDELLASGTAYAYPAAAEKELRGDMTLYVLFTSGSFGKPKGVETSVRSVLNYIDAVNEVLELTPDDVLGSMAPMDYIAAIRDIYLPLLTGASSFLLPVSAYAMAHDLAGLMEARKISVLCWSAAAMELCARTGLLEELTTKHVRKVLFSGSVLSGKALRKWQECFPDAVFINQYGPTEATASCTYYVVTKLADERTVLPVGRPYKNYHILLLDENGGEAGPGETGEICVAGIGVAKGYYQDAAQSAAAFIQNPLNRTGREIIYKTGDLGRWNPEGDLEFLGRKDRQVKIMGHRVEPEVIEQCVKSFKDVADCAVVYDTDRAKLCLFYTGSAEKKSVFLALRERLPAYMVPGVITAADTLPRLANGKTDLKAISGLLEKEKIRDGNVD